MELIIKPHISYYDYGKESITLTILFQHYISSENQHLLECIAHTAASEGGLKVKTGNSERILVDHLRAFQQEQLKKVEDFLVIFGSEYQLFEEEKVEIPRKIQFVYSNIKSLRKFLQNFSVDYTYEGSQITGFSLSWGIGKTYGWNSEKANIKQLMQVLSVIGKEFSDLEKSQIYTLGTKDTPPTKVITDVVKDFERVVNMYAMRNDE
ncbi:MAG: hypothetical protein ACI4VQ_05310 [Clostridia bacterium]